MNPKRRGKLNKAKGKAYERKSADFWSKKLDGEIIPTAGSGSMIGLPGDLLDKGRKTTILRDFVVDVKSVKGMMSKRILDAYNKNKEDAEGKPSFLEIYNNMGTGKQLETYIIISRKDFARILVELQGYREEDSSRY